MAKGCKEIPRPTAGWGSSPVTGTTLGDDIQRMWEMKNYVISRRHAQTLERGKYKEIASMAHKICRRMDEDHVRFDIIYSPFPSCVTLLRAFLRSSIEKEDRNKYIDKLKDLAKTENEIAQEKENFAKMSRIVLDLNNSILQDVLDEQLPWVDCPREAAKLCPRPLSRDQLAIANNVPTYGYSLCDTSLMYILLRNACNNVPPPTSGWTKIPTGFDIGDDIERIRQLRNKFGHSNFATLSTTDYKKLIQETKDICFRFDTQQSHSKYTKPRRDLYGTKLREIETESLDRMKQEEYTMRLEDMNEKERNIEETLVNVSSRMEQNHGELMQEIQGN